MNIKIEDSTITNRTNVRFPPEFYEALDRCVELHDAFNRAVEIGKRYQPNERLLAIVIWDYLKKKMEVRTLRRWLEPLNEEWRANRKIARRKELVEQGRELTAKYPKYCRTFHGDFREVCADWPGESIDLIFTDPPYVREDVHLYEDLGILARRLLKPGGSLFTIVGHYALQDVLNMITKNGMKYWWIIAIKHSGGHIHVVQRGVFAEWKPLLWFVKGNRKMEDMDSFPDFIQSEDPDKSTDNWAQSPVEAKHIIEPLTVEGMTVLDPFMGEGTFGLACKELKRQFIGIEKNKERFEIARAKLGEGEE